MTLVVTVNGPGTIWLLADRRLTSGRRVVREDARKIMFLETLDGVAILGYAGLGATAMGTEPADWMSAVLRGRRLPIEQCLGVLSDAMKRQLPKHMRHFPGNGQPEHHVLITAYVGNEIRFYTIDLALAPDRTKLSFRYTRHIVERPSCPRVMTPYLGLAGSGAVILMRNQDWIRPLLRIARAHDLGKISADAMALHLAELNERVHQRTSDGTVGPRCIVAWRRRKHKLHTDGGAHQCFTGRTIDSTCPMLPTIGNGMDVRAIIDLSMSHFQEQMRAMQNGEDIQDDTEQINAELARLPHKPDETLR